MPRTLVFFATYNEVDNVAALLASIEAELPGCEVLVVDDNSPDGTGQRLDELSRERATLRVIHRPSKLGLGTAHKLAIKYALAHGFDHLITMDADFSHHPKYLPVMLGLLEQHEFVIASRYAPGGGCAYGPVRQFISRSANALARLLLGIPLKETTTAFRGYRRSLLQQFNVDAIHADGYSFFVEAIYQVVRLTRNVAEFPIYFEDRRAGTTKISKREIVNGLTTLLRLARTRALRRVGVQSRTLGEHQYSGLIPCPSCSCEHHVEEYPPSATGHGSSQYRCTASSHSSHGRIVRCLGCGLVYTNPQLSQADVMDLYVNVEDETYLQNVDARVRTFSYNLRSIGHLLPRTGRLLDVGSYCGVFLRVAQQQGYDVLGVEPSTWASRCARESMGVPTITGSIACLPPDTLPFDIVCSWDVLEHLSDPLAEVCRINSLLKDSGVFAFSTLDYDNWFPRLAGERWPWLMDMHLCYFDERGVRDLVRRAGFEVVHVRPYCHIVTVDYLLQKLESLGLWGARAARHLVSATPAARWYVPFRFGDIKLFVCRKTSEALRTPDSLLVVPDGHSRREPGACLLPSAAPVDC